MRPLLSEERRNHKWDLERENAVGTVGKNQPPLAAAANHWTAQLLESGLYFCLLSPGLEKEKFSKSVTPRLANKNTNKFTITVSFPNYVQLTLLTAVEIESMPQMKDPT